MLYFCSVSENVPEMYLHNLDLYFSVFKPGVCSLLKKASSDVCNAELNITGLDWGNWFPSIHNADLDNAESD